MFKGDMGFFNRNQSVVLAELPFLASEIVGHTSFETLFKLVKAHGGTRLYLPNAYKPNSKLGALVGEVHAEVLVEHYGGVRMNVPAKSSVISALQRLQIREMLEEGMPHRAIAIELGVHVKTVQRVLKTQRRQGAVVLDFPKSRAT